MRMDLPRLPAVPQPRVRSRYARVQHAGSRTVQPCLGGIGGIATRAMATLEVRHEKLPAPDTEGIVSPGASGAATL